jgi:hypothetical protein
MFTVPAASAPFPDFTVTEPLIAALDEATFNTPLDEG